MMKYDKIRNRKQARIECERAQSCQRIGYGLSAGRTNAAGAAESKQCLSLRKRLLKAKCTLRIETGGA
jgi:hypothetical protein